MSYIPEYGNKPEIVEGIAVRKPGAVTQVGCVWCLQENTDAPSTFDIVYYWGGTSMCARHMKLTLDNQPNAATTTNS